MPEPARGLCEIAFHQESLVVSAVTSEPVSARAFPCFGLITGNLAQDAVFGPRLGAKPIAGTMAWPTFPCVAKQRIPAVYSEPPAAVTGNRCSFFVLDVAVAA